MQLNTLKHTHIHSSPKKMKNRITFLFTILFCALLASCMKEQLEATYNKQEDQIDQYITKNMIVRNDQGESDTLRVVRNDGANRLVLKEGSGDALEADGYVSFYYAGYTFSGGVSASNLFCTNRAATAEESGWNMEEFEGELHEISLKDAELIEGLRKGLMGVRTGEECEIIFSAKYGFGNKSLGTIPAKTALLYKIWVMGVTND